jgi:predicted lipase
VKLLLNLIDQAYALSNDHFFVFDGSTLAFRGTEDLDDWLTNIQIHKQPFSLVKGGFEIPCGEVHEGFLENWLAIKAAVLAAIGDVPRDITVTGHSLGGALATLCAIELDAMEWTPKLVTFGAPRVGNDDFVRLVNANIRDYTRVENFGDPVPWVPTYTRGFRHAGAFKRGRRIPHWRPSRNHVMQAYREWAGT